MNQSHPREVDVSGILSTAMQCVASARTVIRATMNAAEEIEQPLPREYFALLREKMAEGVMVKRLVFGTEEKFFKLVSLQEQSQCYEFRYAGREGYKRMLLIDESKLLFARREGERNRYFYTEDAKTTKDYLAYFQSVWGLSK